MQEIRGEMQINRHQLPHQLKKPPSTSHFSVLEHLWIPSMLYNNNCGASTSGTSYGQKASASTSKSMTFVRDAGLPVAIHRVPLVAKQWIAASWHVNQTIILLKGCFFLELKNALNHRMRLTVSSSHRRYTLKMRGDFISAFFLSLNHFLHHPRECKFIRINNSSLCFPPYDHTNNSGGGIIWPVGCTEPTKQCPPHHLAQELLT